MLEVIFVDITNILMVIQGRTWNGTGRCGNFKNVFKNVFNTTSMVVDANTLFVFKKVCIYYLFAAYLLSVKYFYFAIVFNVTTVV